MFGNCNILHQLIAQKDWSGVSDRIRLHPREARKPATCDFLNDGFRKSKALPLHHACALDAPKDVVQEILNAFSGAIEWKETGYQRLALHTAVHNAASTDTIMLLLNEHPEAVSEADDLGRLPVHYAIANSASDSVVLELLLCGPKSAHHADYRGLIPLHVSCACGSSKVIIERLLQLNPFGVSSLSVNDETPLDLASNCTFPSDDLDDVVAMLKAMSVDINRGNPHFSRPSPPEKKKASSHNKKYRKKIQPKYRCGLMV